MRERRCTDGDDFIWGFGCCDGGTLISYAALMWSGLDSAAMDVETQPSHQGKGYASCAVHAATVHALRMNALVFYGAEVTNVPSLRIARRLGFVFAYESLLA